MEASDLNVSQFYGHRVRLRACGIYIKDNEILLVNHSLYGSGTDFWSPPGGGVEFGESAKDAVKREFFEETGLIVEVGKMYFVNEFIKPPLHAVEMFFEIISADGIIEKGNDPEFTESNQIIRDVRFWSVAGLAELPRESRHSLLQNLNSMDDILMSENFTASSQS